MNSPKSSSSPSSERNRPASRQQEWEKHKQEWEELRDLLMECGELPPRLAQAFAIPSSSTDWVARILNMDEDAQIKLVEEVMEFTSKPEPDNNPAVGGQ
jgi:hypothetical protein